VCVCVCVCVCGLRSFLLLAGVPLKAGKEGAMAPRVQLAVRLRCAPTSSCRPKGPLAEMLIVSHLAELLIMSPLLGARCRLHHQPRLAPVLAAAVCLLCLLLARPQ
jgi:hypothetical protein